MAKIVEVTNPVTGQPTQVDQLEHTAQQIDDAIARALPGGAIDTALQNNDPRQWGLGKLIGKYVADLNTHLENGWYYTDASTLNCPVNAGAIVEVSNRDNTIEVQTFWYWMGSGILIKVERLFNGTEWKPWEWVNPPMQLGVEYRTTERYQGKPVYVKVVNFGAPPAGGDKIVEWGSSEYQPVSHRAIWGNTLLPYDDGDGLNIRVRSVTGIKIVINSNYDWSGQGSISVTIKYTKTTD